MSLCDIERFVESAANNSCRRRVAICYCNSKVPPLVTRHVCKWVIGLNAVDKPLLSHLGEQRLMVVEPLEFPGTASFDPIIMFDGFAMTD